MEVTTAEATGVGLKARVRKTRERKPELTRRGWAGRPLAEKLQAPREH